MHPSIAEKRERNASLCPRSHVRRLEVFGSKVGEATATPTPGYLEDVAVPTSDADFLVELEPDPPMGLFHAYLEFRDALPALLGRDVDLVFVGAVRNPYVRVSIDRSGELLHVA